MTDPPLLLALRSWCNLLRGCEKLLHQAFLVGLEGFEGLGLGRDEIGASVGSARWRSSSGEIRSIRPSLTITSLVPVWMAVLRASKDARCRAAMETRIGPGAGT